MDVPTTEDLDRMHEELKNWARWGAGDQRGALNHLTDERRRSAAALVRSGEAVSLAHDLSTEPSPDNPRPADHHMLAAGDARDANGIPGYEAARDHIGLDVHGLYTTHVDALSHMFVRGQMYGGRPATDVRSDGARANTVMAMADGVVGRGVLLDVARATGRAFFDTGEVVSVADLEAAERAEGVRVGSGGASGGEGRVRRVLRPAPRVPAVAARPPGRGLGQRRHLRPDAVPRDAGVAVPRAPDRDHGHRPAPDRQRGAGQAGGAVRRGRALGVPVHHGAPTHPEGDGVPGQPGGGPVIAGDRRPAEGRVD